ncbi:MAG: CDGSH iron-sulfur domain-containing protein [Coriobacteriia bacterium]|nr:CDGSH iron-sulfur domain-containing protein [Coriobacteriia bacterium]
MADPKITITKNGPYVVNGSVKLSQSVVQCLDGERVHTPGISLPQAESYALCRCGHSKKQPFCDGNHATINFEGSLTASTEAFSERKSMIDGPTLELHDDYRCAYARFCHAGDGDVWSFTKGSDNEEARELAIKTASECPAGRLVQHDKRAGNQAIEPQFDEPEILLLEDPEQQCSGSMYVRGGVPLLSVEGAVYETRNRYTLCRCGSSQNKPFCDAKHVKMGYTDKIS